MELLKILYSTAVLFSVVLVLGSSVRLFYAWVARRRIKRLLDHHKAKNPDDFNHW